MKNVLYICRHENIKHTILNVADDDDNDDGDITTKKPSPATFRVRVFNL